MDEAHLFGYTPFAVYLSTIHYFDQENERILTLVKKLKRTLSQST